MWNIRREKFVKKKLSCSVEIEEEIEGGHPDRNLFMFLHTIQDGVNEDKEEQNLFQSVRFLRRRTLLVEAKTFL